MCGVDKVCIEKTIRFIIYLVIYLKKILNCLLICLNLLLLSKIIVQDTSVSNMDIIHYGNRSDKYIYLTFDDGYTIDNMFKILETLKEKKVPAIFFLYGEFVAQHPIVISKIIEGGHLVCNHTQNHRRVDKLTVSEVKKELVTWEESYKKVVGDNFVKLFRPPQGFMNEQAYRIVTELNYKVVRWDVQIYDYDRTADRGVKYVIDNIIEQTQNGSIILMHTMTDSNASALPTLIDQLLAKGFVFGRLEEYIYESV